MAAEGPLTPVRVCAVAMLLLSAVGAASPGEAEAPSTTLEGLMRRMAGTSGVTATFREVKRLALLAEPLVVEGTLYLVPPDRLVRVTREPSPSKLVIDGERFAFEDLAGDDRVDLSANPIAREFVSSFIALFNGDLAALQRSYQPSFSSGSDGSWQLVLVPRSRPLADLIARITLAGRERGLEQMQLVETNGDSTTTTFQDVRIDHRLGAEEEHRLFTIGGAGTAP